MKPAKNTFLSFFGVRHEESETVGMFFLHHFFLGLGQAMFFIAAISKFLEKLTPEYLSKVFVLSAVVLMVVGRIYAYYEHTLPFKILLPRVVLVLIGITVVFRGAFYFIHDDALLVFLEIAFFIVYLLSNLEFWGLSALVFDVRQGKRLFSLISSGDVPAKMLGYLCVFLFTPDEKENLLIISAAAFIISYFILKNLLPKVDVGHHVHEQEHSTLNNHNATSKLKGLKDFFGNQFILNLSILSFLYYAVFIMIEFLFYCNIEHTIEHSGSSPTQKQLSETLGEFLGVSYAVIFILKLSYSGRLLNLLGVKRALLAMPVILGCFSFFYFFYGSARIDNSNIFFIGIMAMTAFVVKYAINDPTFLVLFQPMSVRYRLQGHTIIKSFVQSIALAVSGLTLWASYVYWGDKVNFFYYLNYEIFIFISLWIFLVFICYKNYIGVLNEAIKKRFIYGTELAFNDDTYLGILKEKLSSPLPEETLFAIHTLEKLDAHSIKIKIPELLTNTHEGVLNKTIELVVKHRWSSFTPNLYEKLSAEKSSQQSAISRQPESVDSHQKNFIPHTSHLTPHTSHLLLACCTLDDDAYDKLEPYFDEKEPAIRKSLIIGFINSDDLSARIKVEQILMRLVVSPVNSDRILACEVIGELKNPSLQKTLSVLINDADDKVRKAAIDAAGLIKALKLIPSLFENVKTQRFKKYAINSLGLYGNKLEIEHWLQEDLKNTNTPVLSDADIFDWIKICEKIGGKSAEKFLTAQLISKTTGKKIIHSDGQTPAISGQGLSDNYRLNGGVFAALNLLSFKPVKETKEIFTDLLDSEFIHAHTLLKATLDSSISKSLQTSIQFEFDLCIARIFQIFRLLYPTDAIKKAESAMQVAEKEKKANALEILDNIVPKKIYDNISILLENISNEAKVQQLKKYSVPIEPENFPVYIIQQGEKQFTKWTISAAIQENKINEQNFARYAVYLNNKSILLRQSSFEAIRNFKNTAPQIYKSIATHLIEELMQNQIHQHLTDIEKVFVLKSTQLFSETPENIIAEIVPIVKEVTVSKGDIIFNKGDIGSSMYIIYEGLVKIHDGDKTFIENKNRDFFGELALLDPEPRSASATALSDALLLKLDEEEWYELMEDRPEVLRSIMRILCRRIRHQNELLMER